MKFQVTNDGSKSKYCMLLSLQHLLSVWFVEGADMRDVWKFFSTVNGALFVMIGRASMMQMWCANNWATGGVL